MELLQVNPLLHVIIIFFDIYLLYILIYRYRYRKCKDRFINYKFNY